MKHGFVRLLINSVFGVCFSIFFVSYVAAEEYVYKFQGKRDPFVPLISPSGYLLNLEPQDDSTLRLEGVMFDPNGDSIAIINGELVRVGETIGDAVLSNIEPDKVIVIKNNEKVELELRREG
jgi:hypothetical protein